MINAKLQSGFTFIETVVVLGVMAVALPTLFSILFLVLQQQARILKTQDVKRQGDSIYSTITSQIKANGAGLYNAQNGTALCTATTPTYTNTNGTNFYMQTLDGNWFAFARSGNNMFYRQANASQPQNVTQLNTSTVQISNFTISCLRTSQFSPPLISFDFKIASASDPKINFTYRTKVKLRN